MSSSRSRRLGKKISRSACISNDCSVKWYNRITTSDMRRNTHPDHPWSDGETILWGGVAGALAGFSTTPMDVVKTQIMTHEAAEQRKMKYVITSILQERGPGGFFTGAMPRSGWWFCVCSIFFATMERVRSYASGSD
eukprot:Colp12_sorted_trinity150504_noHs@31631